MAREMKDSGIEWIGEIPESWKILKMNLICSVVTDYVASGSFADLAQNVQYLDEPDYAMLVRTADVSNKGHVSKPVFINQHAYEFLSNSNLFGGELLLPNIGAVGEIYIVPKLYERMSLAPNAIICKTRYCDKYYYYYFYCDAGKRSIIEISQSTAQAKFNKTDFKQIRAIVPQENEQHKIAEYLDSECAHIDSVIEQTRASIEEYKKLKQAVITQAVTKGIRPDRQMKDSGIKWIGTIPIEWKCLYLKYVTRFQEGPGIMGYDFRDTGVPLIRLSGLKDEIVSKEGCNYLDDDMVEKKWKHFKLQIGDVVISASASTGIASIVDSGSEGCIPYTGLIRFPICSMLNNRFLRYYFLSDSYNGQINIQKTGSIIQHYGPTHINRVKIALPDISEQNEITSYLDSMCIDIDKLILKKEQLLSDLESYKKSLIYEYVTGKKEVPA